MPAPNIEFHFNLADKVLYACTLLQRLLHEGAGLVPRILVSAEEEILTSVNERLWSFSQGSFLAHAKADAQDFVRRRTPIWLCAAGQAWPEGAPVECLLNFGPQIPNGAEHFARIIEFAGEGAEDRQAARTRWKQYAALGWKITAQDAAAAA